MSAAGYTTIYNEVLRDRTLSLRPGVCLPSSSLFVGLPDFALSKRRLGYACSDSAYLLNAAWKELKQKGIPAALFLPVGKWCVLSCL